MVEEARQDNRSVQPAISISNLTPERWLDRARDMLPIAADKSKSAVSFPGKWKVILSKLQRFPSCLSDLSTHPLFSKNPLCREQLQSLCRTLSELIQLADLCTLHSVGEGDVRLGKLQMQSDLDAVSGKLDLNIRDCKLLLRSGVLGDTWRGDDGSISGGEAASWSGVGELLARLQLGHVEAKHRAVEGLLELMKEDEKTVSAVLGRSNLSAIIQLLSPTTSNKIREKAVAVVCILAEFGNCQDSLIGHGALPNLIRIAQFAGSVEREKALISLQCLSKSPETARMIVTLNGIRPLIEICSACGGDTISQVAVVGILRNLSAVPDIRQNLADEGVVRVMLNHLDSDTIIFRSKETAAECLQNLTASNENLRRTVISDGGIRTLLAYLDGPSPPESAMIAINNLISSTSPESLISLKFLPTLLHVLTSGSVLSQQAAAEAICKTSHPVEMKRLIGETAGIIPILIKMTGPSNPNGTREVAAQALSSLMGYHSNVREVKRHENSIPNLVQLLEHSPENTSKKYAVTCLLRLSASTRCRKSMISYGGIGYLKKLVDRDVHGAKKLLEKLERGRLRTFLFGRK